MAPSDKAALVQLDQVQHQQQDYVVNDEESDLPPAYSAHSLSPASSSASTSATARSQTFGHTIPGLPPLNFTHYSPLSSKVSSDHSTITIVDANLCKSPQALAKFLQEQISIPPLPEIRIKGVHKEWSKEQCDFDIRLNLLRYFLPREGDPFYTYTNLVSSGSGKAKLKISSADNAGGITGVEQWAQAFCADPATDKSFIITRKIQNWDQEYLVDRLHGLLQSLNYRGQASIIFSFHHSRTILKSTSGSFLRNAFISSEKYEVEACWLYASHIPGIEDSDDGNEHGGEHARRRCLVRTESGWFRDWRTVIRRAVLGKRKGWVGLEDWIEAAMLPPEAEKAPAAWGESK